MKTGLLAGKWLRALGALLVASLGFAAAPESAAVTVGNAGYCTAVLIAERHVVTPAHCIGRSRKLELTFAGGTARPQHVEARGCRVHPEFDGVSSSFDLAVCKTSKPVSGVGPAALALDFPTAADAPGLAVDVIGFAPNVKRTARPTKRKARLRQFDTATTALLSMTGCFGDSGSAVFVATKSGPRLLGIVSAGEANACRGNTTVVRLAPFQEWLKQTLHDRSGDFGGGDRHGKTRHLTPTQIDDLVAYPESL